jgi:hypothetical protein
MTGIEPPGSCRRTFDVSASLPFAPHPASTPEALQETGRLPHVRSNAFQSERVSDIYQASMTPFTCSKQSSAVPIDSLLPGYWIGAFN